MLFDFNLQSVLLLVPFTQGAIFTFLFFVRGIRLREPTDVIMGSFVFLSCLFMCPWMLGFAGWYDNQPYRDILFYMPFQNLLFFGPLVFFYIRKLLHPGLEFRSRDYLHFVPGTVYLLYSLFMFLADTLYYGADYYYADGTDKDFDAWYQYTGFVSMGIYLTYSIRIYSNYRVITIQLVSFADSILHQWARNFLFAFLMIIVLKIVFLSLALINPDWVSYSWSWWFYLFFSVILFYVSIYGFSRNDSLRLSYGWERYRSELKNPENGFAQKSRNEQLPDTAGDGRENIEILKWKALVVEAMESEKLYLDAELTLSKLSEHVGLNTGILSKTVNQGFGKNFNDFINVYRVSEVKKRLGESKVDRMTLLGIALDCGFNSKATFNRTFKKITGLTPSQYLERTRK